MADLPIQRCVPSGVQLLAVAIRDGGILNAKPTPLRAEDMVYPEFPSIW